MRPAAAVLVVVLLAACSGGKNAPHAASSPSPAAVSPTTPASTPRPTAAPLVVEKVPDGPDAFRQFSSPSKNIGCAMGHGYVRCDIYGHTWKLPPRPSDCDADWGSGTEVTTGDAAATVGICASDAAGGGPVMAYGHALRIGDLQCASYRLGVECVHIGTRHGFFLSRERVRVS
jgi:hypothetical protein